MSERPIVERDREQWAPLFNWFWRRPSESGLGHGPYPARWIACVAAFLGTGQWPA